MENLSRSSHIQNGKYGMSQDAIDDTKEYIFVKVTDSALRAIEKLQRNQHKSRARAKIQLIGNRGVISFPTADDSEGHKFRFAIDEVEGSIECIKQKQNELTALGALRYKMRIQATDDVYEKTKHRMAVAEETHKNKCTREIKPNQPGIGKKVKLPSGSGGRSGGTNGSNSSVFPKRNAVAPSSNPHKKPSNSGPPNLSQSSFKTQNKSKPFSLPVSIPLPASFSSPKFKSQNSVKTAAGSGTSVISKDNQKDRPNPTTKGKPPGSGTGCGGKFDTNLNNNNNNRQKGNDITKLSIRERLIHLLALKPFKKLELYTRLLKEGISQRDKSVLATILKEISALRENAYHLKRPLWNNVNENWQFFTEQELQTLKRNKPQNLTPPTTSADSGSSSSGQSPPNSSPPDASPDKEVFNYREPVARKKRISHFKRDASNCGIGANVGLTNVK